MKMDIKLLGVVYRKKSPPCIAKNQTAEKHKDPSQSQPSSRRGKLGNDTVYR